MLTVKWLPHEFKVRLPLELDFKKEAMNAERCREIFKGNKRVHVPKVYHNLTSQRVLVMSFEKGTPVSHIKELDHMRVDLKDLARLVSSCFVKMIFEEGYVHSDPHPGNMFCRKTEDNDLQLVILDHGIYTELPHDTRISYTKLWRGILSQDEQVIKEASKELGADFYELFTAIIVNRTYDDVMDQSNFAKTKARLGEVSK